MGMKITGTALTPGTSRNGKHYSVAAIGRATERAKQQIASGRPIPMRTHHDAGDTTTRIVGKLTDVSQGPDGSMKYRAELADTHHAQTIGKLIAGPDPFFNGVSIAGAWVGTPRRETGPDGLPCETCDDLEIHFLDFTARPGVDGAGIDNVGPSGIKPMETTLDGRALIYESAPAATIVGDIPAVEWTAAQLAALPSDDADRVRRDWLGTMISARLVRQDEPPVMSPFWAGVLAELPEDSV